MEKFYTPQNETEQGQLALKEAIAFYGAPKTYEHFQDPELARSERKALYETTRAALFENLDVMAQGTIDEYMSVLERMADHITIDEAARSTEHLPEETAALVEKVIELGPQTTSELFSYPGLAREHKEKLLEAAKLAFWETYEEKGSADIEKHLAVLVEMEADLSEPAVTTAQIETYFPPIDRDRDAGYRPLGRTSLTHLVEVN